MSHHLELLDTVFLAAFAALPPVLAGLLWSVLWFLGRG